METDIEILTKSYNKYKDKSKNKAINLKQRIDSFKAFEKLIEMIN